MADAKLRQPGSRDMDAYLLVHLACGGDDNGCDALLASRERTRWQTGAGRRKTSISTKHVRS